MKRFKWIVICNVKVAMMVIQLVSPSGALKEGWFGTAWATDCNTHWYWTWHVFITKADSRNEPFSSLTSMDWSIKSTHLLQSISSGLVSCLCSVFVPFSLSLSAAIILGLGGRARSALTAKAAARIIIICKEDRLEGEGAGNGGQSGVVGAGFSVTTTHVCIIFGTFGSPASLSLSHSSNFWYFCVLLGHPGVLPSSRPLWICERSLGLWMKLFYALSNIM